MKRITLLRQYAWHPLCIFKYYTNTLGTHLANAKPVPLSWYIYCRGIIMIQYQYEIGMDLARACILQ